eukprot:scaffold3827_cov179-Cylindrotheca_fusiformis.AAC.46
MRTYLPQRSWLLTLLTINTCSHAFVVPSTNIVARTGARIGRRFMSSEQDGDWIKTVNSKEIFFDEEKGRFFETKREYEDDKTEGEVSGPFPANPLKKPAGTFFDDLFSPKEEKPKPAVAPKVEEPSGFSLDAIFKRAEEDPASFPANPLKNPAGTFFDDLLSPKEEKPKPVAATKVEEPSGFSLDAIFKRDEEVPPSSSSVAEIPSVPTKDTSEPDSPLGFLSDLFKPKEAAVEEEPEPVYYEPVTVSNDFRVAAAFLSAGFLLDQIPYIQLTLGPLVTLLGALFLFQSFRIRFVFNEENELELVTVKNILTGETESSGENVVVGGANVWACDTIVNYDFFPPIDSSPVGPILVYFKETQTDSRSWNDGPGLLANKEDKIQSGEAVAGQVHFFPAVCKAEQIRDEFEKRGCGKL